MAHKHASEICNFSSLTLEANESEKNINTLYLKGYVEDPQDKYSEENVFKSRNLTLLSFFTLACQRHDVLVLAGGSP